MRVEPLRHRQDSVFGEINCRFLSFFKFFIYLHLLPEFFNAFLIKFFMNFYK
jgi:hypothetical protein